MVLVIAHKKLLDLDLVSLQNDNSLLCDVKVILGTKDDVRL